MGSFCTLRPLEINNGIWEHNGTVTNLSRSATVQTDLKLEFVQDTDTAKVFHYEIRLRVKGDEGRYAEMIQAPYRITTRISDQVVSLLTVSSA